MPNDINSKIFDNYKCISKYSMVLILLMQASWVLRLLIQAPSTQALSTLILLEPNYCNYKELKKPSKRVNIFDIFTNRNTDI